MYSSCVWVLFGVALFVNSGHSYVKDEFFEHLSFSQLPSGQLFGNFRFLTRRTEPLDKHYELFPKPIGDILQRYQIEEFHLTMSQNFWRTSQWGYQPAPSVPVGVQVWAWFSEDSPDVDDQWRNFVYALSGLFCASFSKIGYDLTVSPRALFRPTGVVTANVTDNKFLRYAALADEHVCTENLTPWKKILPCKNLAGVGNLLTGTEIYRAPYNSLTIDVARKCTKQRSACKIEETSLELLQTLSIVFDYFDITQTKPSLPNLFGANIGLDCRIASNSIIFVEASNSTSMSSRYTDTMTPLTNSRQFVKFVQPSKFSKSGGNLDSILPSRKSSFDAELPLNIHSYVLGTGLWYGNYVSRITNNAPMNIQVIYFQMTPWIIRIFYHTLRIQCGDTIIKPNKVFYVPGVDRKSPHSLEVGFEIPAKTTCTISIDFQRAFLNFAEYPPDAHHGLELPSPAVAAFVPRTKHSLVIKDKSPTATFQTGYTGDDGDQLNDFVIIYGESVLVSIPTPDFSMPYNVICIVCTVIALAFGPLHSLTTKTFVVQRMMSLEDVDKEMAGLFGMIDFIIDLVKKSFKYLWNLCKLKLKKIGVVGDSTDQTNKDGDATKKNQ